MKPLSTHTKLPLGELCALALMAALMFGSKLALAALPNIHLNALLIILTAVMFSWRAMYSVFVYVLLEGLVFGFGIWWISYLYAWPLFAAVAVLLRRNDSALLWAITAAIFGLSFGALCALPYLFVGGFEAALAYWVSGIPFDLMHAGGNFVITLTLYRPLLTLLRKLTSSLSLSP